VTAERWQRIKSLFDGAASLPPTERDTFLVRECADDPSLLAEVRRLIEIEVRTSELPRVRAATAAGQSFAAGDLAAERFRIVRLLGRGGMGEVYEAEDILLNERVALKTIRREIAADPAILSRFRHEIQLARRITNPNVCRIFDLQMHEAESTAPTAFLTMELLLGETLAAHLARSGAMPLEEAMALARQIASGLEAAHQCGVIHRDFKSGNVMLVPGRDGRQRAVITDFGLARSPGPESASHPQTDSGKLVGTLDYMAPEQLESGETSFRSDIYSLGLVLYEMVTGALPFRAETPIGSALLRIRGAMPSPRSIRPELSPTWESVIQRCLEHDPERRFSSPAEIASDLENDRVRVAPPTRRLRLGRSLALAGLVLCVVTGAFLWRSTSKPILAPWRAFPLTSYPGPEFHPALSPDGELVAFAWDGDKRKNVDIYVMQIASGTKYRLTDNPAPDVSPAWSPDNRQIAFRRVLPGGTSQIIVKSYLAGGPERILAEWPYTGEEHFRFMPLNRELSWAPNGKWLVATGSKSLSDPFGLYAISVETGETRAVVFPAAEAVGDCGPALSPDGRTLAFVRAFGAASTAIFIVAVSENLSPIGQPTQITSGKELVTNPAWTADGKTIVFSSDRGNSYSPSLWRISVPRSGVFAKPSLPERLASVAEQSDDATLSGDGRHLAYTRPTEDLNIWELRLPENGGEPANATALISSTQIELTPDFSPDGNKIAFQSNRTGEYAIWTCDRDGSNATPLTSFGHDPHWSPDGKQIVFSGRHESKSVSDLYLVSAQGGTPRRLPQCSICGNPRWSRDGKWIYYSWLHAGARQLWKAPVNGGNPIQVSRTGVVAIESVDRRFVYFTKSSEFSSGLWKVPIEGGADTQVLPRVLFGNNFTVTDRGIYFIPWTGRAGALVLSKGPEGAPIEFLSFATGAVKTIFTTTKPVYIGLAASPDGRSLLFTQVDRAESDLWMVENFR
jgi:serine/threonine protein kinase